MACKVRKQDGGIVVMLDMLVMVQLGFAVCAAAMRSVVIKFLNECVLCSMLYSAVSRRGWML
jgi:hypothetical protein